MSQPAPNPSPLTAAIAAVMAEVGYVQKTGDNQQARYKYASEADLLRAIQPAMANHGLAMTPASMEPLHREDAGKGVHLVLRVTYCLSHASGEHRPVVVLGEAIGYQGKASYAAMTGALKYALRQVFLVPTGDDPDQPHDPAPTPHQAGEWDADRKRFWARVGELDWTAADLHAFLAYLGRPRPSAMSRGQRDALIAALADMPEGLQLKYEAWMAEKEGK